MTYTTLGEKCESRFSRTLLKDFTADLTVAWNSWNRSTKLKQVRQTDASSENESKKLDKPDPTKSRILKRKPEPKHFFPPNRIFFESPDFWQMKQSIWTVLTGVLLFENAAIFVYIETKSSPRVWKTPDGKVILRAERSGGNLWRCVASRSNSS